VIRRNSLTGDAYPPYIKEAKELYTPGDSPKDVMWAVVQINDNITLAREQDDLLDMIEEYWWYIIGSEE
jgi:hypothetical protein